MNLLLFVFLCAFMRCNTAIVICLPSVEGSQMTECVCGDDNQINYFKASNPLISATINLNNCTNDIVLDWTHLQTSLCAQTISVSDVHYDMHFMSSDLPIDDQCLASHLIISNVIQDSSSLNLPSSAFRGLTNLQSITFSNTSFNDIREFVFSELPELKKIKFLKSSFGEIHSNAFFDMPNLSSLEFDECSINVFQKESINLQSKAVPSCNNDNKILDSLESSLTFSNCMIFDISPEAFVSNFFSLFQLYSNNIKILPAKVFLLQLHPNTCTNTQPSLQITGNVIKEVEEEAFIGITGTPQANQLQVKFGGNVFHKTGQQSFDLSTSSVTVEANVFECQCQEFEWHSLSDKHKDSPIISTGRCVHDYKSLLSFLSTECTNNTTGGADVTNNINYFSHISFSLTTIIVAKFVII